MIINIINMVENFDNHKKVDEQNRKIVLQLEAATSLYQMRGFQFTDELFSACLETFISVQYSHWRRYNERWIHPCRCWFF